MYGHDGCAGAAALAAGPARPLHWHRLLLHAQHLLTGPSHAERMISPISLYNHYN